MTNSRTNRDSVRLFVAVLLGGLAAVAGWTAWRLTEQAASARAAAENLRECSELAARILAERVRPTKAALQTTSETEMTGRIEAAAKQAKLPAGSIVLIDPQSGSRVGRTPYKVQATLLQLNSLTLPQIVALLEAIARDDPGLTANTLRLTPPSRASKTAGRERWRAEVVLTRLVYDPITPASP